MDVVAVRADELGPGDSATGVSSRRGARAAGVVVLVVLAALLAALVVLLLRAHDRSQRADLRDAVLQAARQEAVNLTTLSYTTAKRDVDRIVAGATGDLRQRFAAQRPAEAAVLAQNKSRSRGTVLSAGLSRLSPGTDTAQVVLAVDATVTTETKPGSPQSALKHYRMVMKLHRVDGRWLVSDVAFAGVPQ